jgi:hypothetical protein
MTETETIDVLFEALQRIYRIPMDDLGFDGYDNIITEMCEELRKATQAYAHHAALNGRSEIIRKLLKEHGCMMDSTEVSRLATLGCAHRELVEVVREEVERRAGLLVKKNLKAAGTPFTTKLHFN